VLQALAKHFLLRKAKRGAVEWTQEGLLSTREENVYSSACRTGLLG